MPFEYFSRLFPQKHAPYTIREITTTLQHAYAHEKIEITEDRVYQAKRALAQVPSLKELIEPLEGDARHHLYCAAAAARIARRVVDGRVPDVESEITRKDRAIVDLCAMCARHQYTLEIWRAAFISLGINPDEITVSTVTRITRRISLPPEPPGVEKPPALDKNLPLKSASNPTQTRLNPKHRLRPSTRRP